MAEKPPAGPPAQINAYDRHGEKITIAKEDVGKLYALGGKLATRAEVTDAKLEAEYDKASTLSKVSGAVTGVGARNPTLDAFHHGGVQGLTAGLGEAVIAKGADAISPGAGKMAAQRDADLKEAHGTAYTAGEVTGTVGGIAIGAAAGGGAAGAASKLLPSVGIGAVGGAVEGAVGRGVAGLATRGVVGRAAATGIKLGARGAVEGGLYGATQYVGEEVLQDHDLAADKLFAAAGTGALHGGAAGFGLGAVGSLAASGVAGAGRGLASVLRKAEPAAEGAIVKAEGAAVATEAKSGGLLGDLASNPNAAGKKIANELAVDALGSTKTQASKALEYVSGGADAVGEYVNRIGIAPAAEGKGFLAGAWGAATSGRADELLKVIQADKGGRIATGLNDALRVHPARLHVQELVTHAEEIHKVMMKEPAKIAGADAFLSRVKLEASAIGNSGKIAADGTMDAAEAFQVRSSMAKQAYEVGKTHGSAGEAYKDFLRQFDKSTITAIDEAAAKAGKSGAGDNIRHWKREWQLASAAEEMAEGGAERMTRNNTFGIRESIGGAVGLATGNPIAALGTMVGGKLLRERGSALAAYAMSQAVERGSLARFVSKVDGQIEKASRGLLAAPVKGASNAPVSMPPTKGLATLALTRVSEFRADPEGYVEKATRQTESMGTHSPEIAAGIVSRQVAAMAFLSEKVPMTPDPDPLDPHPAPKLTPNEQSNLGRYMWYVEKPSRFFDEVSKGKLTYEGAETAQRLMPRAFEALQMQTMENLATQLGKGNKLPFRQRQILGVLLDMATTPSQVPAHAAFLQQNVQPIEPPPGQAPRGGGGGGKAIAGPKLSALDRLEERGAGRK